jgi:two-component system sensor histidine kinase BaeS
VIEQEIDSLTPASEFSRRRFMRTSVGSGFAAAVLPVVAQTQVKTGTEGLIAGEVTIPVGGFNMPAYRAAPAGKAGAPLVLACRPTPDGGVRIEVRDGGPGLAPEDLAVAFERGRLTERYRGTRKVGSGVGLALVGELARRMGGVAQALPAPEGGVCFAITQPAAPPSLPSL